jgi:hypothetical protein
MTSPTTTPDVPMSECVLPLGSYTVSTQHTEHAVMNCGQAIKDLELKDPTKTLVLPSGYTAVGTIGAWPTGAASGSYFAVFNTTESSDGVVGRPIGLRKMLLVLMVLSTLISLT